MSDTPTEEEVPEDQLPSDGSEVDPGTDAPTEEERLAYLKEHAPELITEGDASGGN